MMLVGSRDALDMPGLGWLVDGIGVFIQGCIGYWVLTGVRGKGKGKGRGIHHVWLGVFRMG